MAEKGGDGGGEVGETWAGEGRRGGVGSRSGTGSRGGVGNRGGVRSSGGTGGGRTDGARRGGNELVTPSVLGVVVKNTGDGIGGVGSFGIAIAVEQLLGIAVVGRNNQHASRLIDGRSETSQSEIDGFKRDNRGLELGKMADHVAAWKVETDELELVKALENSIGDFGGFHPRTGIEGMRVGGDFEVFFAWGKFVTIAIEVVGDVTEFDGFGNGELRDAVSAEESV